MKAPLFCLKLWRRKREKGSFFLAPLKMRRFLSKVCCYHQRWMPWHEYKLCWSCLQTLPSAFTRTNFSKAQNLNFCVAGKNGDVDDTYQIQMKMENEYHHPYDLQRPLAGTIKGSESDQPNHYEAPSCLVRNPSGSLFIPSSSGNQTSKLWSLFKSISFFILKLDF